MAIKPKKSLGQNFLKDRNIILKIAALANPDLPVIEIGPGTGALTEELLKKFPGLKAIEIDSRAIEVLKEKFPYGEYPDFEIIHSDILKTDISAIYKKDFQVMGNIPYYISSQIFFQLYDATGYLKQAVLMIQKDLAKRLIAPVGRKDYGILTIAMALKGKCTIEFDVSPHCFYPQPKVTSSVIKMVFNPVVNDSDFKSIMRIVRIAFSQRRKVLGNCLKPIINALPDGKEEFIGRLNKVGMDAEKTLRQRAEQLTIDEYILLNKCLNQNIIDNSSR